MYRLIFLFISFLYGIEIDLSIAQNLSKTDVKNRLILAKYYFDKNITKSNQLLEEVLKIDKNKKTWEIEDIEWPKVTELLRLLTNFSVKRQNKKGITIFAQKPGEEIVGDISFENVVKIAKAKINEMNTNSLKSAVKSVLGTCLSVGITVDGKHPKEVTKEVNEGKYDSMIQ